MFSLQYVIINLQVTSGSIGYRIFKVGFIEMKKINIKYAADILNLNSSTLRYWEKEGLISFSRGESNDYREFSSNDVGTTGFTIM